MRQIEDALQTADKEDIITVFLALQRQTFVLGNNMSNLSQAMAHSPSYYTRGSIEVWDFIRDQGLNYHLGNAIKYVCRAGHKDSKVDDLKKAIHYLENELDHTLSASKACRTKQSNSEQHMGSRTNGRTGLCNWI